MDCLGLLLMVLVTAADVTDRQAARVMLPRLRGQFHKIVLVWAGTERRAPDGHWP